MQDSFDEWLAAGGLTIVGAIASVVVWMRRMRIRLVSGRDIAEMRDEMRKEMKALHGLVGDVQTDTQTIAETVMDLRLGQVREVQRVDEHERRLDAGGL